MPAEISRAFGHDALTRAEISYNRSKAARGFTPVSGWGATAMTPARCRASCPATALGEGFHVIRIDSTAPWVRQRIQAHLQQHLHRFPVESLHGAGKRRDEFVSVDRFDNVRPSGNGRHLVAL